MGDAAKPFLAIYVVWHPDFDRGPQIAETIRQHFRCDKFKEASGGNGVSVVYRSVSKPGSSVPLGINFDEAETTAIVVLIDSNLTRDDAWSNYVRTLSDQTNNSGLGTRIFPVSIETGSIATLNLSEQALRWDKWTGYTNKSRQQRLVGMLTHEFCRMLRHYLMHLKHPAEDEDKLNQYLEKVEVFLSHTKHDEEGPKIAEAVRNRIHERYPLASFFDIYDIPAGLPFNKVLLQQVRHSAVIVMHTDSFSSREWCRREVIEAKLFHRPLVVANCIRNLDDRSFPYMGNVPVVRVSHREEKRIDFLINRLIDEVYRDFLWRCQVEKYKSETDTDAIFVPRPPELISLAGLPQQPGGTESVIVYPDTPISKEEERLFKLIAPQIKLVSMMEWTAETFQ